MGPHFADGAGAVWPAKGAANRRKKQAQRALHVTVRHGDDPQKRPKLRQTSLPIASHVSQDRRENAATLRRFPSELDFDPVLSERPGTHAGVRDGRSTLPEAGRLSMGLPTA